MRSVGLRGALLPLLPLLPVVALLASCAVGPRYVPPQAGVPAGFDAARGADFVSAAVTPQLWRSFGDPGLEALIERALLENRGLGQAQARLAEARALRGLTVYGLFPTVTAAADRERNQPSRFDPFLPPDQPSTTVYRAGFDAAWELDLFGASRSAAKAAFGEADAAEADLQALRISTAAEVAQAWFSLRGARQRRAVLARTLANAEDDARILQASMEAGRGTELDVARSRTLGATIAAQLPEVEAQIIRHEQRLAVLAALPVEDVRARLPDPGLPLPAPGSVVAIGTPVEWLARRPDVRAAERRLAVATARVGVETADFFPRVSLLGSFGYTAQARGSLFDSSAQRWSYGPSLSWSFLDVGRVRQRVRAAEARNAGALAAFDETVLRALEETENALAAYRSASEALAASEAGLAASGRALELAQARHAAGASDYLVVLDTERTRLDFESRCIELRVARATALAALHKALAGDFTIPAEAR
jgi:multidrug efflux system outer membrane protein